VADRHVLQRALKASSRKTRPCNSDAITSVSTRETELLYPDEMPADSFTQCFLTLELFNASILFKKLD